MTSEIRGDRKRLLIFEFSCDLVSADVDECQLPDACGSDHVCNNTVGSYRCECPPGFVADSGVQNPLDPVCVGADVTYYLEPFY